MRCRTRGRVLAAGGLAGAVTLALVASTPGSVAQERGRPLVSVGAVVETPSLFEDTPTTPDADDPAIWVHPHRSAKSLVLGTTKDAGMSVYDLAGREVQSVAPRPGGQYNNVDLLYGVKSRGHRMDLAVVTDTGLDRLRVFRINPGWRPGSPPLREVTAADAPRVFPSEDLAVQATALGLATWRDPRSSRLYAFVSQERRTTIARVGLEVVGDAVTYRVRDTIELPHQFRLPNGTVWRPCDEPGNEPNVEGMVVDEKRGVLFASQEEVGIWRLDIELRGPRRLVDRVREYGVPARFDSATEECIAGPDPGFGGRHLDADVEGLTIYYGAGSRGYLLASSQGDNTFTVYRRTAEQRFVGSFQVVARRGVDAVQDTDGAAVVNVPLGRCFPRGLLVVHDGENLDPVANPTGERDSTNFKYIRWDELADAFDPDLLVDPSSWHPRSR